MPPSATPRPRIDFLLHAACRCSRANPIARPPCRLRLPAGCRAAAEPAPGEAPIPDHCAASPRRARAVLHSRLPRLSRRYFAASLRFPGIAVYLVGAAAGTCDLHLSETPATRTPGSALRIDGWRTFDGFLAEIGARPHPRLRPSIRGPCPWGLSRAAPPSIRSANSLGGFFSFSFFVLILFFFN